MISFLNEKIFMPYREDSAGQRSGMLDISKSYYEKLGLEVKVVDCQSQDFNRFECYNNVFRDYDADYALIVNADTILSPVSIYKAFDIVKNENIVVKPSIKTISLKDINNNFLQKLLDNDILDNFISSGSSPSFHLGSSWAMNKKTWERVGGFNETYLDSVFCNLDFAIRASICSRLFFLNYDSYTFHHGLPYPRYNILDHSNRIKMLNKFFIDENRNIFYLVNNKINKLDEDEVGQVFDQDAFIKNYNLKDFIVETS